MQNAYCIPPRCGRLARASVLGVMACAAVASDTTLPAPNGDPRSVRLEAFFKAYDCPAPLHVAEYLRAADSHALDYRILPAISLVESTCGAFQRMNNRWGWDSAQSGKPAVRKSFALHRAKGQRTPRQQSEADINAASGRAGGPCRRPRAAEPPTSILAPLLDGHLSRWVIRLRGERG